MNERQRIRDFVLSNFYVPESVVLADEASLTEQGIVDSTGVLEIIQFLEREMQVPVNDDELLPENLDSIARIAAFVDMKRTRASFMPAPGM